MCINSNVTARLNNYYLMVGTIENITFAPYERKDIRVQFDKRVIYFGFSINGHGFDFQKSEDFEYNGNYGLVIMKNEGSVTSNFTPRELTTRVSWFAVLVD